jgi:uncharacterized protein (DUF2062 family)
MSAREKSSLLIVWDLLSKAKTMIFKRRDKSLTFARVKEFIVPKKGWRRAIDYFMYRVKRLPDTPHKISMGLAIGVFSSFTPFFGLHFLVAGLLGYLLKGNIIAAIFGTFFGNPITWPFIASFSVNLGQIILGQKVTSFEAFFENFVVAAEASWQGMKTIFGYGESDWELVYSFIKELFLPYFIGGFVLGLATAVVSYFVLRPIIYAYKVARNKKKFKKLNIKNRFLKRGLK